MLNEEDIKKRLKEDGWAPHVYEGGSKYLLNKWKEVVEQVEKGYGPDYMIEEYWNDLDSREAIHVAQLDEEVKDLDERFKRSIAEPELRIRNNNIDNFFWNYGYPQKASGYFLRSIKDFISAK